MINKVAVQKWVDALRSGRTPRCAGYNRNGDKYCAVGLGALVNGHEVADLDIFSQSAKALELYTGIDRGDLMEISAMNDSRDEVTWGFSVGWDELANHIEQKYLLNMKDEDYASALAEDKELVAA